MTATDLGTFPLHLGLGATAEIEPRFTGEVSWYGGYSERHVADGAEGRLVTMSKHEGAWDMWEMHPMGAEVVICTEGSLSLTQEFPDGETVTTVITAGEYIVNPPGVWHTANAESSGTAVFITAGMGTEHRPR